MSIRIFFMLAIASILLNVSGLSLAAAETEPAAEVDYSKLVDDQLSRCDFKCTLSNSRSENLQKCAREACVMGDFIRANKKQLMEQMQKSSLKPADYKVTLFIREACRNFYHAKK